MEEELKRLQTENQELREQVKELLGEREQNESLQEQVKHLQEKLCAALSQIEQLKKKAKEPGLRESECKQAQERRVPQEAKA